jgi:hypothetical protein
MLKHADDNVPLRSWDGGIDADGDDDDDDDD